MRNCVRTDLVMLLRSYVCDYNTDKRRNPWVTGTEFYYYYIGNFTHNRVSLLSNLYIFISEDGPFESETRRNAPPIYQFKKP
jgi:hypothetical protein